MSASSPYATFRADEWMRHSVIRPRKTFAQQSGPRPRGRKGRRPATAEVQGELFLFPVVLPC